MQKFSIIIPTMWRYEPFTEFLKDLVREESIGEIIIINNDIRSTPQDDILDHPKIQMQLFLHNTFVNPAWNLGAQLAKFETLCIMNDDIIFDIKIFGIMQDFMIGNRLAVVCPDHDTRTTRGMVFIDPFYENIPMYHFGALMFINKRDWLPIPPKLLITHGDNWIWETALCRGIQNYVVRDLFYYTPSSVTQKSGVSSHLSLEQENQIFNWELQQFKRRIGCYAACRTGCCPSKNVM